jgi:hypothetical protein
MLASNHGSTRQKNGGQKNGRQKNGRQKNGRQKNKRSKAVKSNVLFNIRHFSVFHFSVRHFSVRQFFQSEFYLQSELDVPCAESPRGPPEGGAVCVAYRSIQVHPVEKIEEFRSEVKVGAFLTDEPGDLGLFREDEIGVGVTRTQEGIATQVPELPNPRFGKIAHLEDAIGEHVVRPVEAGLCIAEGGYIKWVAAAAIGVEITPAVADDPAVRVVRVLAYRLEGLPAINREGRP